MLGALVFVRAALPLLVSSVFPLVPSTSHWMQHFVMYFSLQYWQIDVVGCFLVSDMAASFHVMTFLFYKYRRVRAARLCYRLAKLHDTFFTILVIQHCFVWVIRIWALVSMRCTLPMLNVYTLSTIVLIGQESWGGTLRNRLMSGLRKRQKIFL